MTSHNYMNTIPYRSKPKNSCCKHPSRKIEADQIHQDDHMQPKLLKSNSSTHARVLLCNQKKKSPQVLIQLPVIISDRKNSANPVSMDAENAAKKDMALEWDGGQ